MKRLLFSILFFTQLCSYNTTNVIKKSTAITSVAIASTIGAAIGYAFSDDNWRYTKTEYCAHLSACCGIPVAIIGGITALVCYLDSPHRIMNKCSKLFKEKQATNAAMFAAKQIALEELKPLLKKTYVDVALPFAHFQSLLFDLLAVYNFLEEQLHDSALKDFPEAHDILTQLPALKEMVQNRLMEIQDDTDFLKQFKAFQKQKMAEEAKRARQELDNIRWSIAVHSAVNSAYYTHL